MAEHGRDLSALTVLEVSGTPGPAFAAALLADFGARVIVVEPPDAGSPIRALGGPDVQAVWWPILARNKLSLALDAGHGDAVHAIERLVEQADIVIRDDTASVWQSARARLGNRALDLHLFAPGADRPDIWAGSVRPELAAAATGAMALTGRAEGVPFQPEMPLCDYTAGVLAAAAALFELTAAHARSTRPAPLAVGLHEAMARMNEWQLVYASGRGYPELRNGNRFPLNANIGNIFRTRDNKLVTISAATPAVAGRLLLLVGGEAARDDARFATHVARREHMDELELLIGDWMARHDAAEVLRLGQEHDVVMGAIFDAGDLVANPQITARGNVVHVAHAGGGALAMPGIVPHIEGMEVAIRREGPTVGQDSDAVLQAAGLSAAGVAALRRSGALWA